MQSMNEPIPQDPMDPGPDGPFDPSAAELLAGMLVGAALFAVAMLPTLCQRFPQLVEVLR